MLRAAAKNFKDVVVISDPEDYDKIIDEWNTNGGISYDLRKNLSQKVFALMSDYNKSISDYLKGDDKKIHHYIIKKSTSEIHSFYGR